MKYCWSFGGRQWHDKGLSSSLKSAGAVDLHGRVDKQSPFAITGRVNPFAATMFVDLAITNANTQITPMTCNLEEFGGGPVEEGPGEHQPPLPCRGQRPAGGEEDSGGPTHARRTQQSPDATSLPLKLGVALLKDSNGRIELEVPVSGWLDDPQFSLAPIVVKIIVNMVVKAAASPFKLLGALAGDDLSFVKFAPGTTNVVEGELAQLGKLTDALAKRPALNLEIEGPSIRRVIARPRRN